MTLKKHTLLIVAFLLLKLFSTAQVRSVVNFNNGWIFFQVMIGWQAKQTTTMRNVKAKTATRMLQRYSILKRAPGMRNYF